jgi:hypothetical protein
LYGKRVNQELKVFLPLFALVVRAFLAIPCLLMALKIIVLSLFLLLVPIAGSTTEKQCRAALWTLDLVAKYGFRPFGVVKHPRNQLPPSWKIWQGVAFTAPDTLAVYQVKEADEVQPFQRKDTSGGGGRYFLEIVFLNRKDGKEVKTLRLTTESSGQSGVYPTHDGRFLVVTGKMLRLYSAEFNEIASRPAPIGQNGQTQDWNVSVVPLGRRVFAYTKITMPFLLDADTLKTIPHPTPRDVSLWTGWDRLFPELRGRGPGVFSADGQWLPLDTESKGDSCTLVTFFISAPQAVGGQRRCKTLRVFSPEGKVVEDVPMRSEVDGFSSNGSVLAAAFYRYHADPLDLGAAPTPLRITVYDLETKLARCSVKISEPVFGSWETRYFDVSSAGSVAVAQQNILGLYEP